MSGLPTLPGKVRGIVAMKPGPRGRTLYGIQCDDCAAVEWPDPLVSLQTVFHRGGVKPGDEVPRLCPSCMVARFPGCSCSTCEEYVHGH